MIVKSILAYLFIILISLPGFSQNSRWENYTDMKTIKGTASVPGTNIIYAVSSGGMFELNQGSGSVSKKFTNINGLISIDLTSIVIDNNNRLWIGASDGSLMIYNYADGSFKYIYDIKNSVETDKSVNAFIQSGNFMYVATGYGIQKISTANLTFVDAPYKQLGNIGQSKVNSLTIYNGQLFAATENGVAYADLANPNLNNPASWTTFNSPPLNTKVRTIESFDNKVFAGSETGAMIFDGSLWQAYPQAGIAASNVKFIKGIGTNLYIISGNNVYFAPSSDLSALTAILPSGNYSTLGVDNNLNVLIGSSDNGVYAKINNNYTALAPNGPFRNSFDYISTDNSTGILWAAGGGNDAGFYSFNGTTWENYNTSSHPEIGASNFFRKIKASNGVVWALGYGGGPTLIQNNQITNFTPANTGGILPGVAGGPNFCVPYGGAFDNNEVFWLSVYATNNGRSVYAYTGNGNFIGVPNPGVINSASLENIAVDDYNTKWIVSGSSPAGLYYYNENRTISNFGDDIFGFYTLNDFGIEDVTDVIVDKNNEVWAATNNGIFIISNLAAVLQGQKPAPVKMRIISGGLAVPFTEVCRTITVDILNQKWVGTDNNGVFHFSEDGSTLIEQFNKSNSPILDNTINTISVSSATGRAYFGTLKGLSSVSTDAVQPLEEFDEITMSPNPFLVPASVDLKIDGLIENSLVKIMSLSGQVIDEFESPGGKIASWTNSRNLSLASGVYIVVAFNKDGSKVGKGKFAVIRK